MEADKDGNMQSSLGAVLLVGLAVAAGVGLLWLIVERGRTPDRPAGRPSIPVRIAALLLGLGAAALLFLGYARDMYVSIAMFLLLGYGVTGLIAALKARSARVPAGQEQARGSAKRPLLWVSAALALVVVVALASYFVITLQQRQLLTVEAAYPQTVSVGDQFDIVLTLVSQSDRPLSIRSLDLSPALDSSNEWILAGATLTGVTPPVAQSDAVRGLHALLYERLLQPGETQVVTLHMAAFDAGQYDTDVAVYLPQATITARDIAIEIVK